MRVIELLGPSGVGKTFLYRQLFEVYTERPYISVAEACIEAANGIKMGAEFSKRYLYYLLLKSGLCGSRELGLSRKILDGHDEFFYGEDRYEISFCLLKRYLSAERNLNVFWQRITQFRRCVRLNFILEKHLRAEATVLFDEGVLHHHHGINGSDLGKYAAKEIKRDSLINPLAVISCELSFDETLNRVLKRRIAGIHTFSHKRLSEQDLALYVRQTILEYKQKIDALHAIGIPVLVLQTDAAVSENLKSVHSFINNLI